jgi:hypothetical protein
MLKHHSPDFFSPNPNKAGADPAIAALQLHHWRCSYLIFLDSALGYLHMI